MVELVFLIVMIGNVFSARVGIMPFVGKPSLLSLIAAVPNAFIVPAFVVIFACIFE